MASMTTSTDPFPPRAASQMHSFIRLRLYCFSRPALFSKESPFVRGYGGIVGERDNQLKIHLLYILDKASILLLGTASALINFKPKSSTSCLIAANTLSNSITFSSVSRFRFRSRTLRGCDSGCESEEEAELIVMGGEDFLGL